ncbi:CYFA0S15e02586g1_1 [Cyberlindnera fabianii]|uniref:CYFA0S15e02586g1_1 n=1 Tax=Cyberlindnera fabianii TaxID=36022 RepID=A0A061B5J6_CYBFA|nr:CYFA0S15e02586g1_1 [Cyberlindnera fabianii]
MSTEELTSQQLAQKITKVTDPDHFDHHKWAGLYVQWISSTNKNKLPMEAIAEEDPGMTISQNLDFLRNEYQDKLNNFGVEFPVDGIEKGRVAWLVEAKNRSLDDPVLVYFHGGGYLHGLIPVFPSFLKEVYLTSSNSDRLSILIVDYKLSWQGGKWPIPVDEATRTLNKLSETSKNFFIGGDSAGAHLCCSSLRHQKHPIESITKAKSGAMPVGAILISPWINIHPPMTGTYETNKPPRDFSSAQTSKEYGRLFTNSKEEQQSKLLNPALDDTVDWTQILPEKTWVYYGDHEVMVDDFENWLINLVQLPREKVFVDSGAYHDNIIVDPWGRKEAMQSLVSFVNTF